MTTADVAGMLRREIEGLAAHKTCRRYSPELRNRVTAWARARLAGGVSIPRVCGELGMGEPTLRRWLGSTPAQGKPKFAEIQVARVVVDRREGPVMRGPCGTSIEGLSVEGLAELLKRLSCLA